MSYFGWTDFWVRVPVIGLIARNANNRERGHREGWLMAEEKLCGAYKPYFGTQLSREKFMQRIEYMKHAGDLGRTPMGAGLKVFLFLLVAAEAMGFSYILGTWAASEGSANLYTKLMYGIVFVLASLLAIVTHAAGAQYYRTSQIRSNYKRYKEDSGNTNFHSTRVISLAEDQFADAGEPAYTRRLNRITEGPTDMGSYGWCWVAGLFVLAIFIGSAVMRVKHMETELNRQSQATSSVDASDPFKTAAPPAANAPADMLAAQQASDNKAKTEERASTETEGVAAILVLSVIFVVTQVVGFGAGHKHCFAGKETYKPAKGSSSFWWWEEHDGAYADTCGYSTYENYSGYLQPRKDQVNTRLRELQHRIMTSPGPNVVLKNTFEMYLALQAAQERANEDMHNQPNAGPAISAPAPVALPEPSLAEKAKRDIEKHATPDETRAYLADLPRSVVDELKPWLLARKEARTAKISQSELDELV